MEDGLLLRILVYYYCLIKCDMRFLFQNHKYGQIIGTLMLLLVLTLFAKLSLDQTQTSAGRKFFLQEISKDMQIKSEIKIKDSIIAEITQGDQTGYALFAKTSGKYKLQLVPDTINLLIPEQDGVCFEEFLYQLRPNERKGNS